MTNREFTTDWFSFRIPHWEAVILPNLPEDRPLRWLEIGSYEGRSACWTADFLASRPGSELHCVDVWFNPEVEARFDANTEHTPLLHKHKRDSFLWLAEAVARGDRFDVAYIDGDHQAKSALGDAVLAWRLLPVGGLMIFDDYPWKHPEGTPDWKLPPKFGIDAFLEVWGKDLKILRKNWQVYIQKTR
jgi:predicted O-methyltransferase YrrM